ncbi:MAG TPA: hypothetical protein VFT58_04600 [Nitrososphaera sp.]|nr:hypothetical protein [Nitrososphaera sp.]
MAVFVLVIIGVLIAAFLFVKRQHDNKPVSTTAAEVVEAGSSALGRNAQNTQRKNDASVLLTAVAEYQTNNSGQMPTQLDDDMLKGMGYYTGATLAQGEQAPVTTDELRLVTGARCLASGATAPGTSRQHAAQFSLKTDDDKFEPQCIDG